MSRKKRMTACPAFTEGVFLKGKKSNIAYWHRDAIAEEESEI